MRWLGAAPCTPLAPCTSLWVPRASLRLRPAALGCLSFHTRPTVRGCQGATRFDCQKLEKKVENQKFGTGFSPNWWTSGENGGYRRVRWS